jgi:hypothetical protein
MGGGVLEMLLLGGFRPENLLASVAPLVALGVAAVREDGPLGVKPSEADLAKVISVAVKQDEAAKDVRHDDCQGFWRVENRW